MKIEVHTTGYSIRAIRAHKIRYGVYMVNLFGLAIKVEGFTAPDDIRQFIHFPRQELENMRAKFWGRMMERHPRMYDFCYKHLPIDTLPF